MYYLERADKVKTSFAFFNNNNSDFIQFLFLHHYLFMYKL